MGAIQINILLATILLFGTLIFLMFAGLPVMITLAVTVVIFILALMEPASLEIIGYRTWDGIDNPILLCIPMFIFMGLMMEESGIANNLYATMYKWSGGLRGGLAAGTVGICMIMAAMTGISAAATLTMGLVALPEMLKRGYHKSLAIGCILGGGALGTLIPPSITMVIYALVAETSIGQLFIGGIIPGILLGLMFIIYILVRAFLQPGLAPALPKEDRATWADKGKSLAGVILPIFIIGMVLGTIFLGLATPTEASGAGAFGTLIAATVNRKLNFSVIKKTCFGTALACGMIMWLLIGSYSIKSIIFSVGIGDYVQGLLLGIPGGIWATIVMMQIIWIILGCVLDPIAILFITCPIFVPIIANAGMSTIWFGIVFVVNMEMAYLTPPFGMNLFYMRSVAPPSITISDIYKSIAPFVGIQLLCLALVMIFKPLSLWLPGMMISK